TASTATTSSTEAMARRQELTDERRAALANEVRAAREHGTWDQLARLVTERTGLVVTGEGLRRAGDGRAGAQIDFIWRRYMNTNETPTNDETAPTEPPPEARLTPELVKLIRELTVSK